MRASLAAAIWLMGGAAGVAHAAPAAPSWLREPWLQAPQVEVEHAAARLVVVAEPRAGVSLSVTQGRSRLPPLSVRQEGGRIKVDGGLGRAFGGERIACGGPPNARAVSVGGYGRIAYADLPVVTAHVPLDARVAGQGAVYGQVGPARSVGVAASGCGDWTAGPVQGVLEAALTGSGGLRAADAGALKVAISGSSTLTLDRVRGGGVEAALSGSGDVHAGPVEGPVQVIVSGSGDLEALRVDGPVRADIAGSGAVRLKGGTAPQVEVRTSGSGDFAFGGQAGRVQAVASGSGGVRIAHASGPVSQASFGSADIQIGR